MINNKKKRNKNRIKKIEGLSQLVNLEVLWLFDNQIKKIEGLENCKKLQHLNLSLN